MNPSVCCVLLTADRQAFTDRAVKCFLSQTYENKYLLIYDTGVEPWKWSASSVLPANMRYVHDEANGRRIGALRNAANSMVSADVIAHWDSDDWSAPERLAWQVGFLEQYPANGFADMIIADTRRMAGPRQPDAWLYTYRLPGRVLGSSLLYYRQLWAFTKFHEGKTEGEETHWPGQSGVHTLTSMPEKEPLMVAEYHGGNTGGYGKADNCPVIFDQTPAQLAQNPQWRRVSDWDAFCGKVLYP